MNLEIIKLTSNELGYVACICQSCLYRPAFDVLELRFDTNITVSLEEDERDSHLIVHGNPIENLNITITRISDNETETSLLTSKKTSFFNDSLLIRFQQEHSHFFVRYYSLIVQECILCPPRLSSHIDGDYLIEICRIKIGDCALAKGYLDHPLYEVCFFFLHSN
uniref:Uncharacterized protein n=1 Tax=Panagrolaimus superbus TaxID=310955 RepID=A0A914Z2Q3_9BILA